MAFGRKQEQITQLEKSVQSYVSSLNQSNKRIAELENDLSELKAHAAKMEIILHDKDNQICRMDNEEKKKRQEWKSISSSAWGEYSFHEQMSEIIKNRKLKDYHFFSNVYFPAKLNRDDNNRNGYEHQADHILVCPYGVYLFNTKCWKGTTYIWPEKDLDSFSKGFFNTEHKTGRNGVALLNIKTATDEERNGKARRDTTQLHTIYEYNTVDSLQIQAIDLQKHLQKCGVSFVTPVLSFVVSGNEEKRLVILRKPDDLQGEDVRHGECNHPYLFCAKVPYIDTGLLLALTFHMGCEGNENVARSKDHLCEHFVDNPAKRYPMKYSSEQVQGIADFINENTVHGQFLYATGNQ